MGNKPIVYNSNHYTVIANDIIKGKQELTLTEARLVRLLITQVVKEDKDLKTYTCRIQDLADFLNVSGKSIYRDVKKICDSLMQRIIRIDTGDPKQRWKIIQWVQLAEHDGHGNITLELSEKIAPYVLELNSWFTQYRLGNILSFNSFYAIRMYELIKCFEGITRENSDYHEFTIDYLRTIFCCEEKYTTTAEFIRKVISISIREINEKSDIELAVEQTKQGKKIIALRFSVWTNQNTYAGKKA